MMKRTTVSTKGQVVLPKEIRERRHWRPGTELVVEERPEGVLLRSTEKKKGLTVADFAGIVKYKGPAKSVEEMNAAIEEEFRARHARGRY
jgi:AbrB family looped-hinge helix DNA binding protein